MLVKRNESYTLGSRFLGLESSGDLDVKIKVEKDLEIKGFTFFNIFNWTEAEKKLQEVMRNKKESEFYISSIYKVKDDLDLENGEIDEEEEFISGYVDNNLIDKIGCMTLEEIIDKYWDVRDSRPVIKSIDNSYIVLECDDWDNDLVLYIDARMGYSDLETQYYLVHEDN